MTQGGTASSGSGSSGSGVDVAVVGAGIAGLTAASIAAEHGLRVTAFDALAPGGQLVNISQVHDYPGLAAKTSGADLSGVLLEAAMNAGVEISYAEVTGLYAGAGAGLSLETTDQPLTARSVVVATGRTPGRLSVPDADSWVGRGLSECASCDGPLYSGRRVAVVGADEWAAREAEELAGLTESVSLLVPGLPRWSAATAARLAADGRIEVRTDTVVVGLLGETALSDLLLGDGTELPVSGVFVYTGKTPRTGLLAGLAADTPGLFMAGDVRREASPYLLNAAADGLRAGLAAAEFVGR